MFAEGIYRVKNENKILGLANKGDLESIKKIDILCENDPNFYYDDEDERRLINFSDDWNRTPLYIACENGNLELVKSLLDLRASLFIAAKRDEDDDEDDEGETPLECASRWGYKKLVEEIAFRSIAKNDPRVGNMIHKAKKCASNKACKEILKKYSKGYKKPKGQFACTTCSG